RRRDLLAARGAGEVALGLEHVVEESVYVPAVAGRRRIEIRRGTRHLRGGPFAGPGVQVEQVCGHRGLLVSAMRRVYPAGPTGKRRHAGRANPETIVQTGRMDAPG